MNTKRGTEIKLTLTWKEESPDESMAGTPRPLWLLPTNIGATTPENKSNGCTFPTGREEKLKRSSFSLWYGSESSTREPPHDHQIDEPPRLTAAVKRRSSSTSTPKHRSLVLRDRMRHWRSMHAMNRRPNQHPWQPAKPDCSFGGKLLARKADAMQSDGGCWKPLRTQNIIILREWGQIMLRRKTKRAKADRIQHRIEPHGNNAKRKLTRER